MPPVLLPVVKCHHSQLFAMQISKLWHLRLMSSVRTYLVAGLALSGSDTGLLQPRVVVRGNKAGREMSRTPFRHQPLTARGINASKSGWGHQVWVGVGRWHTRAGAEDKGLADYSGDWEGAGPLEAEHLSGQRLSFTFPHFWAAQGGVLWSAGEDQGSLGRQSVLTTEIRLAVCPWGEVYSVGLGHLKSS